MHRALLPAALFHPRSDHASHSPPMGCPLPEAVLHGVTGGHQAGGGDHQRGDRGQGGGGGGGGRGSDWGRGGGRGLDGGLD